MKAYSSSGRPQKVNTQIMVLTNHACYVGQLVEVVNTHEEVLNTARAISVMPNPNDGKQKYQVRALVVA